MMNMPEDIRETEGNVHDTIREFEMFPDEYSLAGFKRAIEFLEPKLSFLERSGINTDVYRSRIRALLRHYERESSPELRNSGYEDRYELLGEEYEM